MSTVVCSNNYIYQGQVYSPAFSEPSSPSSMSSSSGDLDDSPPISPMSMSSSDMSPSSVSDCDQDSKSPRLKRSNSDGSLGYINKQPRFATKYDELLQPLSPVTTLPVQSRKPLPIRTHRSEHDIVLQRQFQSIVGLADTAEVENFLAKYSQNVDINQYNEEGRTPLQQSCFDGSLPMAKLFIQYGADTRLTTREGFSTLHVAAFSGQSDVLMYIMSLKKR